jgi:hypothetical protein
MCCHITDVIKTTITIKHLCSYTNVKKCCFSFLQESCQNYIRILTITTPGILLACGTNSYRPMCNYYNITGSKYHLEKSKHGQALCPYGPKHNSTSVFVGKFIISLLFNHYFTTSWHAIIVVVIHFYCRASAFGAERMHENQSELNNWFKWLHWTLTLTHVV